MFGATILAKSVEVFWWSLFSAGGVTAALFVPVLVIVTGLVLPFGAGADYEHIRQIVSPTAVRIGLLVIVSLSWFHCAHRIRHILMDLGLRSASRILPVLCYGGALLATVVTASVLTAL